ncbi:MAG: threonine synthase [Rhodospirillales bacterium]
MRYISTRGLAPELGFDDILLAGLARDGGLYVPKEWPSFTKAELSDMKTLSYNALAFRVVRPFISETFSDDDLQAIIAKAYGVFTGGEVAPIINIGSDIHLMELFHGPTLAFKDVAMQMLGGLFDHVLKAQGEHITIVGATSGDTGSAAIEACRGKDTLDIFMLFPEGRVSEVQRRQMTTVLADNVHNLQFKGTFDDCQDLVKAMFNDQAFRDRHRLSAVNSINWARVMAQIVYYFHAALHLGAPDKAVSFTVPTGNFGNVFAGYAAKKMGLPIKRFIVAANANDILARFFESGEMRTDAVVPTLSPSMDIQISSNFERLLFDMLGRDGARVESMLKSFRTEGSFRVDATMLATVRETFDAARFNDAETTETMRQLHGEHGMLIDPHTAVGLAAAKASPERDGTPMVVLATAHPAKFPDAVEAATGIRPPLPSHMSDLYQRPERAVTIDNRLDAVEMHIDQTLNATAMPS